MLSDYEKKVIGFNGPWKDSPSNTVYNQRPSFIDLSLNYDKIPYESDTAIIVTSWWGHLPFLKATLMSYRMTGKFVLCAFDQYFKSWNCTESVDANFPSGDIFIIPHSWVFKHISYENNKREGWFWDVRYAQGIIKQFNNFKYVFTVNGDCVWENPGGVDELISMLGENDIMSISSDHNTIHTCAVVYKIDAFNSIMDYMEERYRLPIFGSLSPERMIGEAVKQLGIKEIKAPKQPMSKDNSFIDHYSSYNQDSTWKDIVGYRNLGSEYLTAIIEGLEPIDIKYVDFRYFDRIWSGERETMYNYYKTGDRRYLYMAWDRNEDSWHDRLYYPIEHYGKEPIYDKEM